MALAPALGLAFTALLLLALRFALVVVIGALLVEIARHVPAIGARLASAVSAIVAALDRWFQRALDPTLHLLITWWRALVEASSDLWDEVVGLSGDTAAALRTLVTAKVPALIAAQLSPVLALHTALRKAFDGFVDRAEAFFRSLGATVTSLSAYVHGRLTELVEWLRDVALVEVERRLLAAVHKVEAVVTDVVLPRLGALEAELPRLRIGLDDLRRLLDQAREWLVPIASVFGAAAVIELLRHVRECKPKTERLCRLDLDELDELLGIALALPSLALILQTVRSSAHAAGELTEAIKPTLTR